MFKIVSIPYNLSEFKLPELSFSNIDKVVGLLTIVGAIGGINKIKPKIQNTKTISTHIDYSTNELIEEKEYEFKWGSLLWGRILPQKVELPKLSRESIFQLLYKPYISYKQPLPRDPYEVVEKGSKRIITLVDKRFFDEAETNCINVETTTSINEDYRTKISCTFQEDSIVITNDNYTKICNYPIKLQPNIEIDRLTVFNFVSEIINPRPGDSSEGITLMTDIPPKQANSPGRKVIPLQRT